MTASILIVDDEPDVAKQFRQRFRRETRQGTYVMHFAASGAEALDRLAAIQQHQVGKILASPEMAVLRGDSRVKALRKRFGLPPQ